MIGATLCAEEAVRTRVRAVLAGDAAVMGAMHQIYVRKMPRMTPPYIWIGGADGRDWGTKDRAGREVLLMVTLVGGKSAAKSVAAAMAQSVTGMRGEAGGWEIVAARILRSRWLPQEDGGWQSQITLRCRCLILAAAGTGNGGDV